MKTCKFLSYGKNKKRVIIRKSSWEKFEMKFLSEAQRAGGGGRE
jgi:hypothetical protein